MTDIDGRKGLDKWNRMEPDGTKQMNGRTLSEVKRNYD